MVPDPDRIDKPAVLPVVQSNRVPFLAMCREEPFRLFFPLGLANGVIGLALWPLFIWGVISMYPALMHARIMVEGFMGAFIVGFLGTAGPRLLSARSLSGAELGALITLELSTMVAHLTARPGMGDTLFLAQIVLLIGILVRRFIGRGELPPPNFVLVGAGMLCGAAGAALVASTKVMSEWPRLFYFGSLALSQGFVLLPVLGVGVFLFPRFLDEPFEAGPGDLRRLTSQWKRRALFATATAILVTASFAVESIGDPRAAAALRFAAAIGYIAVQMPAVLKFGPAPFMGQCIRVATWLLLLGLLSPLLLPTQRLAGLHILFIGGFMLTVFIVAARVMLGHSGQLQLCQKRLPFLLTSAILLLIALATRVGADFVSNVGGRNRHLLYAALLCISAAFIWGARLIPRIFIHDTDE